MLDIRRIAMHSPYTYSYEIYTKEKKTQKYATPEYIMCDCVKLHDEWLFLNNRVVPNFLLSVKYNPTFVNFVNDKSLMLKSII